MSTTRKPGSGLSGAAGPATVAWLATWLGIAGCGGGASPATPPAPAPPPPAVTVSFEPGPIDVREGQTTEIRVIYQVRTLDAPWQLAISTLPVTASAGDFELATANIEIPAGQGVSGEASVELAAVEDVQFDEGDETVAVRFVPGGGVNAQLGADLEVRIRDAGVTPCPGLVVAATSPAPGGPADVYVSRSFTFQVAEAHPALAMEFVGPYIEPLVDFGADLLGYNTNFALNIAAWEFTIAGDSVEHTVDIQMRRDAFRDPNLELAFHGGGCDAVGVACSTEGCGLKPVR